MSWAKNPKRTENQRGRRRGLTQTEYFLSGGDGQGSGHGLRRQRDQEIQVDIMARVDEQKTHPHIPVEPS